MKLRYKSPKRERINYRFMGITTFENGWWYHEVHKKWIKHDENWKSDKLGYCSHQPCRSKRSFVRKLKKCPIGIEFILSSRWVGYDIRGKGTLKS